MVDALVGILAATADDMAGAGRLLPAKLVVTPILIAAAALATRR